MKTIAEILQNVDKSSVELADLNHKDAPDYVDAYIQSATYKDGTELTEEELNLLSDSDDFMSEMITNFLY